MQQLELQFDVHKKYRRTDPETSKLAAKQSEVNSASNRAACLVCVREHPGLTAVEIARLLGLKDPEPNRRLAELCNMGLVKKGPDRKCRYQNSLCATWYLV